MPEPFANLSETDRVRRLEAPDPDHRPAVVLDTDTYNELDDQYALTWLLLRQDRLDTQAVHAAPFHNDRSTGPADGMERSYEEILRVLDRLGEDPTGRVFRGSASYLPGEREPVDSPAARDLIERAMSRSPEDPPLYVAAIGAPTNVASAILLEPAIVERIVVVWLGGQPGWWQTAREFNLMQDPPATRVLLDSGVPLVRIPCKHVAEHLRVTRPEVEAHIAGRGPLGDYLAEIVREQVPDTPGVSKVVWDLSAIAWLLEPAWVPTRLTPSPILQDDMRWSHEPGRHLVREAIDVKRDAVFEDLFARLEARG